MTTTIGIGAAIQTIKKYIPRVVKRRARKMQKRLLPIGAKYYCLVCNSRVSAFQPLPDFIIENVKKYGFPFKADEAETCNHCGYLCPNCGACDRDRLYALFLKSYLTGLRSDSAIKIVDFAPTYQLSHFVRERIALSRTDISYRTADLLEESVDDKVDLMDLHLYDDNQFSFFICSHVLEHVTDDGKALTELYRILKPGGKGILMVPIVLTISEIDEDPSVLDEGERWRRFGQNDHVRLYSKNGFIERVANAGFTIHQYGRDFFGAQVFTRNGINLRSVLYVVEK